VFCASMADVFDNHRSILPDWRANLWSLIAATPHLDWLLLTKRPQNIAKMLPPTWSDGWPNVWLGTTVENQTEADRRIPHLLATPARVRFLSCEPLLGPVDLTRVKNPVCGEVCALTGYLGTGMYGDYGPKLAWVICGGESGPGARPMHPDWARSLRDQCQAAGVPFFMKQMSGPRKATMPPIPDDLMVREFPNV
jgi:protein gp37